MTVALRLTERWGTEFNIGPRHLASLTSDERRDICVGLRLLWPERYQEIHQGMLPFVPAKNIRQAIWLTRPTDGDEMMRKLSWRMYYWHKLYEAL